MFNLDYKEEMENKLPKAFKQIASGIDHIAENDENGYVAYMLSDGNSFGEFVREMDVEMLKRFNKELPDTVNRSLFSVLDRAYSLAQQCAAISRFVYLNKPIAVVFKNEIHLGKNMIHMRLKAYVVDHRFEMPFITDMSRTVYREFRKAGLISK